MSFRFAREWQPLYRRLKDIMIKDEASQVIAYCDENKISYKPRPSELWTNPRGGYDAKFQYTPEVGSENARVFLKLIRGGIPHKTISYTLPLLSCLTRENGIENLPLRILGNENNRVVIQQYY